MYKMQSGWVLFDKPYPSCLIYGSTFGNEPVHSVWAYNGETKPFEKCPVCGGELEEKEVEKLLKGGVHVATLKG